MLTISIIILAILDIALRTIPSLVDTQEKARAFFIIETFTIAYFTLDFTFKFIVCPHKLRFFYSVFHWLELFSIIPFYVSLAYEDDQTMRIVRDISRVFRVCSLLKFFYKSKSLSTIVKALSKSGSEILIFLIYFSMAVIIFSTLLFYVESQAENSEFFTIPQTFWYHH
jgi:hypothetical protein